MAANNDNSSVPASPIPPSPAAPSAADSPALSPRRKKKLLAFVGNMNEKQQAKIVIGRTDAVESFGKDSFPSRAILYFKNDKNCSFRVDSRCTKIFVENCHGCKFEFNGSITTGFVEVWHCSESSFQFNKTPNSLQADLNKGLQFIYKSAAGFSFLIWAGCYDMSIRFLDQGAHLPLGLNFVSPDVLSDIPKEVEQFQVSFVNGVLTSEPVVRLEGGYPSTDRQADKYDERHKILLDFEADLHTADQEQAAEQVIATEITSLLTQQLAEHSSAPVTTASTAAANSPPFSSSSSPSSSTPAVSITVPSNLRSALGEHIDMSSVLGSSPGSSGAATMGTSPAKAFLGSSPNKSSSIPVLGSSPGKPILLPPLISPPTASAPISFPSLASEPPILGASPGSYGKSPSSLQGSILGNHIDLSGFSKDF